MKDEKSLFNLQTTYFSEKKNLTYIHVQIAKMIYNNNLVNYFGKIIKMQILGHTENILLHVFHNDANMIKKSYIKKIETYLFEAYDKILDLETFSLIQVVKNFCKTTSNYHAIETDYSM